MAAADLCGKKWSRWYPFFLSNSTFVVNLPSSQLCAWNWAELNSQSAGCKQLQVMGLVGSKLPLKRFFKAILLQYEYYVRITHTIGQICSPFSSCSLEEEEEGEKERTSFHLPLKMEAAAAKAAEAAVIDVVEWTEMKKKEKKKTGRKRGTNERTPLIPVKNHFLLCSDLVFWMEKQKTKIRSSLPAFSAPKLFLSFLFRFPNSKAVVVGWTDGRTDGHNTASGR